MINKRFKYIFKPIIIITIVIISALINAFGVKNFMHPMHLIPVGVPGLAIFLSKVFSFFKINIPYYLLFLFINTSIGIWAYYKVSKNLVLKTILYIIMFTIFSKYIPVIYISKQPIVMVVGGAICNAVAGILLLFIGSSAGGYNFIGLYISKKKSKSYVGITNSILNYIVILLSIFLYSIEVAILSLIASTINAYLIDKFHNQSNYVSLFIVTKNPGVFSTYAVERLNRTATIIESKGSYSMSDNKTIILTLSKHKFGILKKELMQLDSEAHITIYNVNQIIGNMKSKIGKSAI